MRSAKALRASLYPAHPPLLPALPAQAVNLLVDFCEQPTQLSLRKELLLDVRHLSVTRNALKFCALFIEGRFRRGNQYAFDLIEHASNSAGDSLCLVIPSGQLAALIHAEKAEPTEITPPVSEVIPRMASQSAKQARITLSRLTDVDRMPSFVVKDVNADLFAEIYSSTATSSFQFALLAGTSPKNGLTTPDQAIVLDHRRDILRFRLGHGITPLCQSWDRAHP